MAASTSRLKETGSFWFIATREYNRLKGGCLLQFVNNLLGSHGLSFSGYGLGAVTFERGNKGVPGQDGTLDAGRKFVDACKHSEFADVSIDLSGHDHFVHLVEYCLN